MLLISVSRVFWVGLASFCLLSCQARVIPDSGSKTANVAPESKAQPAAKPSPSPRVSSRHTIEGRLLKQAQHAFREARYTTPSHDNAYDKFRSVLMINPQNAQARAGLQAILLQYAQLARTALGDGRLRSAKNYLSQAETFYPNNALLVDLKKKLRKAERELSQSQPDEQPSGYEEVKLAVGELNTKAQPLVQMLGQVAQRLKQTEESVLIFARNDREGRWIYKQLKNAVPGYRVRGDIRISSSPRLRILPPL